jgi:hypothetical protein
MVSNFHVHHYKAKILYFVHPEGVPQHCDCDTHTALSQRPTRHTVRNK